MDRALLRDLVHQLETLSRPFPGQSDTPLQAISQFNALLKVAKFLYPNRADIQALKDYERVSYVRGDEFADAVRRLRSSLDLRPLGSASEVLAQIRLPPDAPADIALDMRELEGAINLGLTKTALLLAGSIAEALLLSRVTRISQTVVQG